MREVGDAIQEVKAILEQARKYARTLKRRSGEYSLIKEVRDFVENAKNSLDDFFVERAISSLSVDAITEYVSSGRHIQIVLENLRAAVRINREFSHEVFFDRLVRVFTSPSVYEIRLFSTEVMVKIQPDSVAGDVHLWRDAVEAVRQILRGDRPEAPQSLRLHFWREKFYAPAREGKRVYRRVYDRKLRKYTYKDVTSQQIEKYWRTINLRMSYMRGEAPFWKILNYGSVAYGGGEGYPQNVPTNFVEKSELQIKREISRRIREKIRNLQEKLSKARQVIDDLNRIIYSGAVEEIRRRLAGKAVSAEKLEALFKKIFLGLPIEVTKRGTVELTKAGEKRVRISLKSIARRYGIPLVFRR